VMSSSAWQILEYVISFDICHSNLHFFTSNIILLKMKCSVYFCCTRHSGTVIYWSHASPCMISVLLTAALFSLNGFVCIIRHCTE
jgi:hypothetical protein